jgi:uncharacterized RmlC-like cupin family protein
MSAGECWSKITMAYIFHQNELPKLLSVVPGRERVFFVNRELAGTAAMLAGIMRYNKGASSPYHLHENCEPLYFIIDGVGAVETSEGTRKVEAGDFLHATPLLLPAEQSASCALAEFFHVLRSRRDFFLWEGILCGPSRYLGWNFLAWGVLNPLL